MNDLEQSLRDAASWNQLPEGNVIASKALITQAADTIARYEKLEQAARKVVSNQYGAIGGDWLVEPLVIALDHLARAEKS